MKIWNSPGDAAARPEREHSLHWLARLIEVLSRGETPVDGCSVEEKKPELPPNPEPVRWGNFR